MLAVSSGANLEATVRRIVQAAVDLVSARYGAVTILGRAGQLDHFVQVGVDDASGTPIGSEPCGGGVLDAMVSDGQPLRLDDVTKHPAFVGFPPGHPPMRTFLGAPIRSAGRVVGRLYLTGKTGGQVFTDNDTRTVQALADAVGMAVDNAQVFQQARRARQWLEAASDVTSELLGSGDTGRALNLIADRAMELSAADTAMVVLPSDPQMGPSGVTDLRVAVCVGVAADTMHDLMIPVAGSTPGAVFTDQLPRSVPTPAVRPGFRPILGPGMASPLGPTESTFGVLVVTRTPGSAAFDDDDLTRLSLFADNAALALHLAEGQRLRELRVLADRDRVARDLYDHVMQQLFGIGLAMQITRGRPSSPSSDARTGDHIDQLQEVVRQLRRAIFGMEPGPAVPPRLRTSLMQMITMLTRGSPLRTSVQMSGALDELPPDLAEHAAGVVREGVGNAVRHSHAAELIITIAVEDELVVQVIDDGVGGADPVAGAGLHDLARRASDVAGSFTVAGADGGGTRLVWTAPLP